jgi:hypothetical protein
MLGWGKPKDQVAASATPEYAPPQWIYRNLTPWRIEARFKTQQRVMPRCEAGADLKAHKQESEQEVVKVLAIPALGEVKVPREDSSEYNTLTMRRLGQIEVRPAPSELWTNMPRAIVIFGWLAVALFFGAWALFSGGASGLPWQWVAAMVVAVPVVALLVASGREMVLYGRFDVYRRSVDAQNRKLRIEDSHDASTERSLEGVEGGGRIRGLIDGMPRHVAETVVLLGAVIISVIGLGVAIHLTTQLVDLLPIDYGALLRLQNPFDGVTELSLNSPAFWQLLVGHIAQWVLVSIAALAPAAMYFQFDRQRLASVQRRWVQEVFRLDPTVRTVRDIEAKYGSQIESAFGELSPDSGLRLGSGRRSPVIVATILLVVGWFLVISTTDVPPLISVATNGAPIGGGSDGSVLIWRDGSFPVASFFWPHLSAVGYAFLGSYVFTLFHVLRGYQRRDLHPKSYNTIVVRILAAYALALVVGIFTTGQYAEIALFFVGFMPESALVWMREKISATSGVARLIPLREPAPLTDLEGIDLYDRTRLAEEGINNVEGLAHADIVDLMSSTRISAAQLVDWTDQAILYLRVGGDVAAKRTKKKETDPPVPPWIPDVRANVAHLRSYGIRTATDLLQVYERAIARGHGRPAAVRAEVDALRAALELRYAAADPKVCSIQTIIDTLQDEEWFVQICNWRASEFGAANSWYRYLDGIDWEIQCEKDLPALVEKALRPVPSIPMAVPAPPETANGTGLAISLAVMVPSNGGHAAEPPQGEPAAGPPH